MMKRVKISQWIVGLGLMAGLSVMNSMAAEPVYPNKPVTLVVPYQGGITEQMSRLYAAELEKELGVSVIVEVKPGAGGVLGTRFAANAKADGYTLVVSDGLPQETVRGKFDTHAQLEPITPLMAQPFLLYVKPDSEIKNFKDYLEAAKTKPGSISYGSVGPNSTAHVIGQTLEQVAGVRLVHVPFRGGGAQALSVMSGETSSGYLTAAFLKSYAEGQTLRPIAFIGNQRNSVYPEVPSIAELGYPQLGELNSWWAVFTPKGIPTQAHERLLAAADAIYKRGAVVKFAKDTGGAVFDPSPDTVKRMINEDIVFWQKFLADKPQ